VIVTAVVEATEFVVAVKVAVVAPAATVTDAGTWAAAVLLEVRLTTAPPVGAALLSVTVPVEEVPPATDVGLTLTPESVAPAGAVVTVRIAVRLTRLYRAVIVAVLLEVTAYVVTVKVAVVAPAATVTEDGGLATLVRLLDRVTTIPPAGAGPVKVTVPIEGVPPATEVGSRLTEARAAGAGTVTVSVAVRLTLL
jgi:hypothetical protein